ncbi:unnamed protein product [Microthlaspi erraticum]|uniref:Uncharacterized protein n=1 Tax=Microthlaspi erraticum TaxID=1685480 RepID=A0A6D2J4T8_9BRAS|nr:unnamed protein product [Microthlaspi erraticum]
MEIEENWVLDCLENRDSDIEGEVWDCLESFAPKLRITGCWIAWKTGIRILRERRGIVWKALPRKLRITGCWIGWETGCWIGWKTRSWKLRKTGVGLVRKPGLGN